MSEPLLQAIMRLFAIVAKEDNITKQEHEQIRSFLMDHLNKDAVNHYLEQFDSYINNIITSDSSKEQEYKNVQKICKKINAELTQKQKTVIILELISIIIADGHISEREDELVKIIGDQLNIRNEEIDLIKKFIEGTTPEELNAKSILFISEANPLPNGEYHFLSRKGLTGFISLLHLEATDTYFIKHIGNADLFLNGVPLKKNKIQVFAVGATLRGERIQSVYYGDVISHFITKDEDNKITFEAKNISYQFKNGKLGLRDINIIEESGRLIGLMGASGAGKSTLLHVLNGQEKPTEGQVLINGIDIHNEKKNIEGVIGFVPQDDLLIEELTVYQNLYYAAKLCFDQLDEKDIDELVLKTLNNLGLRETKDLKVGSPLQKTISGGQRKRLNIGLELLREPSVMFVDEPTSGLSSRDSENIMDLLKELSLKGKLIFVVIHQPSSDIFKMFDKLVILDTGGYQIYYGNPVEAVVYFKSIINLINSQQGECLECGNVNPEQIFNIIETKVINEYGNFTNERKISPQEWNQLYLEKATIPTIDRASEKPKSSLNIPDRLKQIRLFGLRDLFSKLSNKQYLLVNLLEAPVLAVILAYIVRYNNVDTLEFGYFFGKNLNIPAYLFMSVIVAIFMGLTVSAEEIIRDRKILKREAFLNLSRSSYLLSKISILFLISAIQTLTFVLIGNAILDIQGMFWEHWFILFSAACLANLLGLNISSAFDSAVTIYILIPVLLIPQLVLSGVVVQFDELNPTLSNKDKVPLIGEFIASRWAFEAAMVTQFKDNEFERQFYPYDQVIANADYKKLYYIPTLESKLADVFLNYRKEKPEIKERLEKDITILKNEINKELQVVGHDKFDVDQLDIQHFDSAVYDNTNSFLQALKTFYISRYNKADQAKDHMILKMTKTPEQRHQFEIYKNNYHNESISQLVKNQNDPIRIMENDHELVQKIFPVYMNPQPEHLLDFRAQFYVPQKHIMGFFINTYWFNMGVLWFMIIILYVTLYFDLLRKFVRSFSRGK
ncbi:MAG: ATP-binding cassette domain-containing protein [Candidatus Cyclobacteriaceae bacterium M2_1C_046]